MFKKLQVKFVVMVMVVVTVILAAVFVSVGTITTGQAADSLMLDMEAAIDSAIEPVASPSPSAIEKPGRLDSGAGLDADAGVVAGAGVDADAGVVAGAGLDSGAEGDNAVGSTAAAVASEAARSNVAEGLLSDSAGDSQGASQGAAQSQFTPPEIGGPASERNVTPVAVYRLDGNSLQLASRTGAMLDPDVLNDVSEASAAAPEGSGTLPSQGIAFLKRDVMGQTYIAFANDSAAENARRMVVVSLVVGTAALLVFFFASIVFSRWALRPVRNAWEQQRRFVTNASHDLKTPLSIIKANTEVLLDEPDACPADRERWLNSTKDASEGMERLIGDMLELASLDELSEREGKATAASQAQMEEVDISRLLERCALQFESCSFEGGFELGTDIQQGVRLRVNGKRLEQIVQALLDNACKYVNPGGKVLVELVASSSVGGSPAPQVKVSNTGDTIVPEDLEHIFDRFYRVDKARDTTSGHGLGLSLAKSLSESIGATLSVASESGVTTFTLHL